MNKIKTISVLGPTASGKTGLSIELAKLLDGEIISCDSMQLYRGMNIGTAKPTEDEKKGIPHHLIDVFDPGEEFSGAEYVTLAAKAVEDIASRGKTPIICGGTGLYHDLLMNISSFEDMSSDEELRGELYKIAENEGAEALHGMLADIDPQAAENIHPNNVKRVVRAIEVFKLTGKTKTQIDGEQINGEKRFDDTAFVIEYRDRNILYSRIEKRVDAMIEDGLEDEARRILLSGNSISRTAMQAIGYKEFIPYFEGHISLDDVIAEIKLSTRHYAKRQLIWFRRSPEYIRLYPDDGEEMFSSEELSKVALDYIHK